MKRMILILFLILFCGNVYSEDIWLEVYTIGEISCLASKEIDDRLGNGCIYYTNGFMAINITFNIRLKDHEREYLLYYYSGKIDSEYKKKEEIEREIEERLREIPDEVKLFDERVSWKELLRIYLVKEEGEGGEERIDITKDLKLYRLSNSKMKTTKRDENRLRVMLMADSRLLKKLRGRYHIIEVIYDSTKVDEKIGLWKGKIEGSDRGVFTIREPKNRVQMMAAELGKFDLYWRLAMYYAKDKKEEKELYKKCVEIGEKVLREEPRFYGIAYDIGIIYYEEFGEEEEYLRKAYKYLKYFKEEFDKDVKRGHYNLNEPGWDEYNIYVYGPLIKKLEYLKEKLKIKD